MKRILVFLLAIVMIISCLASCNPTYGDDDDDEDEDEEKIICENCNAKNDEDSMFCRKCGESLIDNGSNTTEKPYESEAPAYSETEKLEKPTKPLETKPQRPGVENPLKKQSINVCLGYEPDTLDPALNSAVDGATILVHLFSGLAKWTVDANGNYAIVPDLATELVEGVENYDGSVTYTYTLRDNIKWSNGDDVTAYDFENSWKRAASWGLGADYGYMFEVIKGYGTYNTEDLAVRAIDYRTLEVTLNTAISYWNELLAFPTYFPVHSSALYDYRWATDPATYICNGAYRMKSWEHDSIIVLEKNPNYYAADTITMDTINCYLSDDANNMLANFKKGDWLLIDDIPTNEIANLKKDEQYKDEFVVAGQIGTYYVCWNINENLLPADSTLTGVEKEKAQQEIRKALGLLFDRNHIVNNIAQGGQTPASSFVSMGMTDADGTEFYKNANSKYDSFNGYYDVSEEAWDDNISEAIEILAKYYNLDEYGKITNMPSFTYLYNESYAHKAIGEYLQAAFATKGVTMNLQSQEWNTFLNTRKNGDYSVARNGWVADYNDPICFLDMWTSNSSNNDVQFGKGAHASLAMYNLDLTTLGYNIKVKNGTWAQTYDVLIATIKSCKDQETRYKMMHMAEDMLMDTGCIMPLYYYTDLYMIDSSVEGFFSSPLGYKYFMYATVNG